jgi:hypothetical protein
LPDGSNIGGPPPGVTVQKRNVKFAGSVLVIVQVV